MYWRERRPELFDGDFWRLPLRSYLIRGGGRAILVDTGVGWNHAFEAIPFVAHRDSIALSAERGRPLRGATGIQGEIELAPGVVAFETPGHLPGHMSIRVGGELVVLGDVAVHPAQLARPGLGYVYNDDPGRASRTREEVLSAYGDRILACGHFPGSGFGRMADGIWSPLN